MKVDININLNLDEIKEILDNDELRRLLATSIGELRSRVQDINKNNGYDKPSVKDPKSQEEITLEKVRAKLAELMQGGKQAEVKALLQKHGGEKLSDISEENYPALLKDAEAV